MPKSPRIDHLEWGAIEVQALGRGGDMKLWPGGGREWNWLETGTHHDPGIQVADVEELLEHGAAVVVLSRGMNLVLRTCPETISFLKEHGIRFLVEETREAAHLYNELASKGESVGGLFHSTC